VEQRTTPERAYEWLRGHPFAADAAVTAVALFFAVLVPALVTRRPMDLLIGFFLVAPLAWRRTAPVPAVFVVAATGLAQTAWVGLNGTECFVCASSPVIVADAAVPFAMFALAAYGPPWAATAGLVLGGVGAYGVASVAFGGGTSGIDFAVVAVMVFAVVLASWALGQLRRMGRREQERLVERARLLELERDQEARLAANAERARIAREMHDVVAHSLSVTVAQADGGRYAGQTDPAAALQALETISRTGRQALADMRALLGVLRDDEAQQRAPQPDAAAIPELVKQVEAGGLEVYLQIAGQPAPMSAGAGLAAYRIVQESLTNVLKHAGPGCRAWVNLRWLPDALEVWVADDGRGAGASAAAPDGPPGQGLLGMRERATLYGGRLEAGPVPGGGFGVRAVLPYGRVA
jgi:signal transduction histidine kinase